MKKQIFILSILATAMLVFTGCGNTETQGENDYQDENYNDGAGDDMGEDEGIQENDSQETEGLTETYWSLGEYICYYFDGTTLYINEDGYIDWYEYTEENNTITFNGSEYTYTIGDGGETLLLESDGFEEILYATDYEFYSMLSGEEAEDDYDASGDSNGDTSEDESSSDDSEDTTTGSSAGISSTQGGFENRYWLSDSGAAYYFDGSNYKVKYDGFESTGTYQVIEGVVWLDGLDPFGSYEVNGNTLTTYDEWGDSITYTEITEDEYNGL